MSAATFEQAFVSQCQADNIARFQRYIARYDQEVAPQMRARGFKRINQSERTVLFTFGEVTFSRSRWHKKKQTVVPVDDQLGLEKNSRFSRELLYQLGRMALHLPYRKVADLIHMTYRIHVTKDTVQKAVKLGDELLEEQAYYRYFEEEASDKRQAKTIYVDGDGVMVKTTDQKAKQQRLNLSHFVIYTGRQKTGKGRYQLLNKKEIVHPSNVVAREQVIDYLYNHYHLTEDTLLITNSDMGAGYGLPAFREIAKTLNIQRHEHFWDTYHVYKLIKDFYRFYPKALEKQVFKALTAHSREALMTVLDTTESLLETDADTAAFSDFRQRLLALFRFTKPPHLRGLDDVCLGVIESQHRKLTYRMKHRGMYWSVPGARAISSMIILDQENQLRDLFFGSWREDCRYYRSLEQSAAQATRSSQELPPEPPKTYKIGPSALRAMPSLKAVFKRL